MTEDLDAIREGIRLPWSTGPVEGHIHRLKLLKRLGYGRAQLPLLRARLVVADRIWPLSSELFEICQSDGVRAIPWRARSEIAAGLLPQRPGQGPSDNT